MIQKYEKNTLFFVDNITITVLNALCYLYTLICYDSSRIKEISMFNSLKKKHYFNWGFSAKSYLRISTVCYNFRFPYTKNPVMVRSIFPFKIKKTLIFFQSYIFDKKNMKMCERCCWFCTKVSMEYMNCLQLFDKVFFYAISVESIMFVCFWMLI